MSADSPELRREEPLMALITRKNTMIFSGKKKRKKLLSLKRKIGLHRMKSQMKKNSSTLPSWMIQRIKRQVLQPLRYSLTNISDLTRDECKITIDEMSNELYNMHVSLKSLTKENSRLKGTIESLSERNS